MKKVLHHSRFEARPFGHGGERRTTQIVEYFKEQGYAIETVSLQSINHFKLACLFKSFWLLKNVYGLADWYSIKRFFKWWKMLYQYYPSLEQTFSVDAELFIWESTSDSFYFLPYFAKKMEKKVYAYPHNIESLVKEQKSSITGKFAPKDFLAEIDVFSVCDKIFSISLFDHQLLQLFNINSEYFSYYPPKEVQLYLKSIKMQRDCLLEKNNKLKQYLIAGTVYNPPTRMGMETLINWINNNVTPNCKFTIAGYGTEIFQNGLMNSNIEVLGSLSNDEMEKIMIKCEALLIYHIPTTGVLTRVVEFNIAGIPVVLNAEAAYSFFGMSGVFFYADFESIMEIFNEMTIKNI